MAKTHVHSHDDNDHHQDSGGSPPKVKRLPKDPMRLARRFLLVAGTDSKGRLTIHYWRGEWWLYKAGAYRRKDEQELRGFIVAFIEKEFDRINATDKKGNRLFASKTLVSNVLEALQSLTQIDGDIEQPVGMGQLELDASYIAFRNGLYNLKNEVASEFTDPTPEWFSPHCLPFDYDANATCEGWETFLREIFPNDEPTRRLLQELAGYCLTPSTKQHKFFVLTGKGANGKSVLLEVLTALIGAENVSHQSLGALGEQFGLAPLVGKLANISAEIEARSFNEELLKKLVGGDPVTVNRKNRDQRTYQLVARLLFATNNLPPFNDRTEGLWRRAIIIPCPVTIPPEKQDRTLADKLKRELPGIFNWAIEGLRRLREQGEFTEPETTNRAKAEHRAESNPERLFFAEHLVADSDARMPKDALYERYREWCLKQGMKPLDGPAFGREVKSVFPEVKDGKTLDKPRRNAHLGIGWVGDMADDSAHCTAGRGDGSTNASTNRSGLTPEAARSCPQMPDENSAASMVRGKEPPSGYLKPKAQAELDAILEALDKAERNGLAPIVELRG